MPPAPHLQGVTFDLWATLMHSTRRDADQREELRARRMYAALKRGGRNISLEQVRTACQDIWKWLEGTYWDKHTDPGFEAQIAWLRDRLEIPTSATKLLEEVRSGFVDPIFELPPSVDPAAMSTLQRVHDLGLKVGLICNTSITPGSALRRLLANWGLDALLPVQLYSEQLRVRKPAPAIFQEAADQLGVEISAMLHVGDQPINDVQGALDAGAQALQVGPAMPLARVSATIAAKLNI
jgi:FMN phosphatase YigB (HAD superfamily)